MNKIKRLEEQIEDSLSDFKRIGLSLYHIYTSANIKSEDILETKLSLEKDYKLLHNKIKILKKKLECELEKEELKNSIKKYEHDEMILTTTIYQINHNEDLFDKKDYYRKLEKLKNIRNEIKTLEKKLKKLIEDNKEVYIKSTGERIEL